MPTQTTNYSFNKPIVNNVVDEDLWGGQLNDNWDSADSLFLQAINFVTDSKSADYTVVAADIKKLFLTDTSGGNVTYDLPAGATAGNGFTLAFKKNNASNSLIIDPNGSETIDGDATLTLTDDNDCAIIVCDGTNWHRLNQKLGDASTTQKGIIEIATNAEFFAGTATDKTIVPSNFVNSLTDPGYARVGGLIIQWGVDTFTNTLAVNFPITFPNAFLSGSATLGAADPASGGISSPTTTGMTLESPTSGSPRTMYWIVVGY